MEKPIVLDLLLAIHDMLEDDEFNQFDTVTKKMLDMIYQKAKEIANED